MHAIHSKKDYNYISGIGLAGTIPTEIGLLTNLEGLRLGKLLGQSYRYYRPLPSCALRLLAVSSLAEGLTVSVISLFHAQHLFQKRC
jgi:hypothetical protein